MNINKSLIEIGLATVSSNGLVFNDFIYTNTNMIKSKWFEIARLHGAWTIPILYNPLELSEVILFDLSSIEVATHIIHSNNMDPESRKLYFERLNDLKKSMKEKYVQNKNIF